MTMYMYNVLNVEKYIKVHKYKPNIWGLLKAWSNRILLRVVRKIQHIAQRGFKKGKTVLVTILILKLL